MNILFVGDISGRAGREAFHRHFLPAVERHHVDLAIANAENAAGGFGITPDVLEELLASGVHVLTSGNHIWDHAEALALLESEPRLLRPLNYPAPCPGRGLFVARQEVPAPVAVINLQGRIFMDHQVDCPFRAAEAALASLPEDVRVVIVDFHGEATSEKAAMGWHLDGRVTAVLGTHTHVQTADERLLPQGTAFITDVGMTGPYDSVIGVRKEAAIERLMTGRPRRLSPAKADARFAAVVVEADPRTGRALSIRRILEGAS